MKTITSWCYCCFLRLLSAVEHVADIFRSRKGLRVLSEARKFRAEAQGLGLLKVGARGSDGKSRFGMDCGYLSKSRNTSSRVSVGLPTYSNNSQAEFR